jgi:hypothetical protein
LQMPDLSFSGSCMPGNFTFRMLPCVTSGKTTIV